MNITIEDAREILGAFSWAFQERGLSPGQEQIARRILTTFPELENAVGDHGPEEYRKELML